MDFKFTEEEESFRQEIRQFLKQELPSDWVGYEDGLGAYDKNWQFTQDFVHKVGQKGWLTMHWPKEYAGQGRSHLEQLVFNEEMNYRRAPLWPSGYGLNLAGPTIIRFGTEEQKKKYLPGIAGGELWFCQGFSEPGAGSDLASVQIYAREDGDDFVLNGQKTWTSNAHRADYNWLIARTNRDVPKHKGLSMFVVDMKVPGVTVRPLLNMANVHYFNEVYFDDVRVPKTELVGEKDGGWYVAMATLDFERSGAGSLAGYRSTFDELLDFARETKKDGKPLIEDPLLRPRLAEITLEFEVGRWLCYRVAWQQNQGLIPNYEASMSKLYVSSLHQRAMKLAMECLGLYGQLDEEDKWAPLEARLQRDYMWSLASTIRGGTNEVQQNIIGTRGLGLPR